jgi:hypothetical protein
MLADGETDGNGKLTVTECNSELALISGMGLPHSLGFCAELPRSLNFGRLSPVK